jgi:hypothetical protein
LGNSNNEKGDENSPSCDRRSMNHVQNVEEQLVDEDVEMPDIDKVTQPLCTEPTIMRKTSSSSSLEKRLADITLWGHIDPRTEWLEWPQVVSDEDIDAVLAARRAHSRQLGECSRSTIARGVS